MPDKTSFETFLLPGTIIDQYIIERPLASGGFSAVYLARQLTDRRRVVIKEYLPRKLAYRARENEVIPLTEEARPLFLRGRRLFLDEAMALSRVKHANIVEVISFFCANATVYLAMTYEYGRILADYIQDRKGNLSEQFLMTVFPALLDGLNCIHAQGLLHLDIKPQNILIRPGGAPLLLDFGAVQSYPDLSQWRPGKVLTGGFSPIEQYQPDGKLGPWSDLYAVGATLRMSLDGIAPLHAPQRSEKNEIRPAVEAFKGKYRRALLAAVDWAMAVEPSQRPQVVSEFLSALSK
jgi:serine/threonine protein kinase